MLRRDCIAVEVALFRTHLLPLERQEQELCAKSVRSHGRSMFIIYRPGRSTKYQAMCIRFRASRWYNNVVAHSNGSRQQQHKENPLARRPPETCTIRSLFCSLIFFKEPRYRSKCCSRLCYPDHNRSGYPCPFLF